MSQLCHAEIPHTLPICWDAVTQHERLFGTSPCAIYLCYCLGSAYMTHHYFALAGSHSGMAVVMTALYILS